MHIFAKKVIAPELLLQHASLPKFLKEARRIAGTNEAIVAFNAGQYKDYADEYSWSAEYFGSAVELLAETFFEEFGHLFNIMNVSSLNDFNSTELDSGVDHYALSTGDKKFKGTCRIAHRGSPVYIQTKATLNKNREYKTNDGSRLPNFFMNAQVKALQAGQAYQARYIIFTTGKGLHYKLKENSGDIAEVVNFNKISKLVNNNEVFWNKMRSKCGVKEVIVALSNMDPEAKCNEAEND